MVSAASCGSTASKPPKLASCNGSDSLLANVLLVNLPQLIFSLLYFGFNGICTSMSLAAEWGSYSIRRKGLRLSSAPTMRSTTATTASSSAGTPDKPRSAQRATYFLQLPLRRALPLLLFSAALHWLISQSFFLVYVEAYAPLPFDVWEPIDPGRKPYHTRLEDWLWPWLTPGRVTPGDNSGSDWKTGIPHATFRNASSAALPLAFPFGSDPEPKLDPTDATAAAAAAALISETPGAGTGTSTGTGECGAFSPWYPATLHVRAASPLQYETSRAFTDITTCGWSPTAVLCVLVLGTAAVVLVVWAGWGTHARGSADMPVAGSCSAAISAACHLPPARRKAAIAKSEAASETATETDTEMEMGSARSLAAAVVPRRDIPKGGPGYKWEWDAEYDENGGRRPWERPLMWGVVLEPDGDIPGRCAFSPGPVGVPVEGLSYA